MKIENKYKECLKTLMKTTNLDEINVVMLCKAAKSNRQTFYYHFRDISDVIESIFLKEKIGTGIKVFSFENIIKPIITYINQNKTFLTAVAKSFASDKLIDFFYSYFYQRSLQLYKLLKKNEEYSLAVISSSLRCIASLLSKEMFVWVLNKNKEKQVHLQKRLTLIWNYFSEDYIVQLKSLK